jgi:Tfp pilus assembly protein PilV
VELLVSVIILMVGLLGMFQVVNVATDKNVETLLRQRGVEVAENYMNDVKARPFANLTGTTKGLVRVAVGSAFKNISVQSQAATVGSSKQISVRVWWRYRGRLYEHQTASALGNTGL